jgi:PAS domain S-box-containing protein
VEERVKHLNAVLRAIRDINQLIVREKNRRSLLQGVCNTLIAARGYYDAWIALLDESGALEAAAEAGLGEDFPLLIERLKQGEPTYCMQKALTQVDILTIGNPTSTCIDCPLSNKYGDRAGMAVQLEHAGEAYGLLVVSTSAKIVADKEELELLEEIARDIALALHDIELKEAREQAEEALRQSEKKYRTLHESMMDAFISVDMAGHIVEFNSVYKNILGYPEEELYNLTYVDITPEKWHASEARIVDEQILERGYSDVYEKEYRKKDGTVFPVELRTFLIRDEAGRPTGMWAVVRDITERKRAEVQLAEQLDELRRWHAATLGRETRILDLKHEVNELLAQAGQPPRYPSAEAEDQ